MSEYSDKLLSQLNRTKIDKIPKIVENLNKNEEVVSYVKIVKLILNAAKIYVPIGEGTIQESQLIRLRKNVVKFLELEQDNVDSDFDSEESYDDYDPDETDSDEEDASSRNYTTSIEHRVFREKYSLFFEKLVVMSGGEILDDENNILKTFLQKMSKLDDGLLFDAITIAGLKMMTGLVILYSENLEDMEKFEDLSSNDLANCEKHLDDFYTIFFEIRHNDEHAKLLVQLSDEMLLWLETEPKLVLKPKYFNAILLWIEIAYANADTNTHRKDWRKLSANCTEILERIGDFVIDMYDYDREFFDGNVRPLCEQFMMSPVLFGGDTIILRVDTLMFAVMIVERLPELIDRDSLIKKLEMIIVILNDEDRDLARAAAKFLCATLWKLKSPAEQNQTESDQLIKDHLLEFLHFIQNLKEWQHFDHSSFLVDSLMFIHPMITDWKLLIDVCFAPEPDLLQSIVTFDVLQRSVFHLIDPKWPKAKNMLKISDEIRLEKTELFNKIFLSEYLKLLTKYSFNETFIVNILKMASFFDPKFIDETDQNKTFLLQIVHECIKIFNEMDKYYMEIMDAYQGTIVDGETPHEKILRETINVLVAFKSKFPFCKDLISEFAKDLHGNYMIEFQKWLRDNESDVSIMKNYTKILIQVSYVQIFMDFEGLKWKVIYDDFFRCNKPLAYNIAYIVSLKMCYDNITKTLKLYEKSSTLSNDIVGVFVKNRNNYMYTLLEYFEKPTVNLSIRKECFFQLQRLLFFFDANVLKQFSKHQLIIDKLTVVANLAVCDSIVQFLNEYVCNRVFPVELSPDKTFEQLKCLNALHYMIEKGKFPVKPFVPVIRQLLTGNRIIKKKAEKMIKELKINLNSTATVSK